MVNITSIKEEAEISPLDKEFLSKRVLENMVDLMEARRNEFLLVMRPAA